MFIVMESARLRAILLKHIALIYIALVHCHDTNVLYWFIYHKASSRRR